MRLDIYLYQNGHAASRAKAKELIEKGSVSVDGQCVKKPAFLVQEGMQILICTDDICPYVSRGGLKLMHALHMFEASVDGKICLDIGASTGGFTDCLLQNGARAVYALDCGKNQLHEKLRTDSRVTVYEGYNAKNLSQSDFPIRPTFAVMDVSFISQTLILPALYKLLDVGAEVITLIKPQFELTRAALSKKGIVKAEKDRQAAIKRVMDTLQALGFSYKDMTVSPVLGGDGNTEYLIYFSKEEKES